MPAERRKNDLCIELLIHKNFVAPFCKHNSVILYTNGVKKSIAFEKRNRIPFYNFEICRFDSSILYIRAENVG